MFARANSGLVGLVALLVAASPAHGKTLAQNNIGPVANPDIVAIVEQVTGPTRQMPSGAIITTRGVKRLHRKIEVIGPLKDAELRELAILTGYFQPSLFRIVSNGEFVTLHCGTLAGGKRGPWSEITFRRIPGGWKFLFQQDWLP